MKNRMKLLILTAIIFAGCATIAVHSDYVAPGQDFSDLKTYAWVSAPQGDEFINEELDLYVRSEIDSTLQGKGYRKISSGTPDFGVDYEVTVKEKGDEEAKRIHEEQKGKTEAAQPAGTPINIGSEWVQGAQSQESYYRLHGLDMIATPYEEGTLVIDVIDPSSKKIIWRGSASAVVHREASLEKRKARGREAVGKILAQFPPK